MIWTHDGKIEINDFEGDLAVVMTDIKHHVIRFDIHVSHLKLRVEKADTIRELFTEQQSMAVQKTLCLCHLLTDWDKMRKLKIVPE